MKFNKSNAYTDFDYETAEEMPDALPLNIISGGCHLYGYLLKPGAQYEGPHPAVVMFHGFPGYTTNNDLEYALMRMGCVVIHVNHRGAWGRREIIFFPIWWMTPSPLPNGRTTRRQRISTILTRMRFSLSDTVWEA